MFGITGGYHRYFSHRSFKLGRVPRFALAVPRAETWQFGDPESALRACLVVNH